MSIIKSDPIFDPSPHTERKREIIFFIRNSESLWQIIWEVSSRFLNAKVVCPFFYLYVMICFLESFPQVVLLICRNHP